MNTYKTVVSGFFGVVLLYSSFFSLLGMEQSRASGSRALGISVWDSTNLQFKPYRLTVPNQITGSQLREVIHKNTAIEPCFQLLIKDIRTAGNGYTAELQEAIIDHWVFPVTDNMRFIVFDTRKNNDRFKQQIDDILKKKTISNDTSRIITLLMWEQGDGETHGGYVPLYARLTDDVTVAELKRELATMKGMANANLQIIKMYTIGMLPLRDKDIIEVKNNDEHEQFLLKRVPFRMISVLIWQPADRTTKGGYVPVNLELKRDVTVAELKREIERVKGIPRLNQQLIKSSNMHMYRMLDKQTIDLVDAHIHEQFILFDKSNDIVDIPNDLQRFYEPPSKLESIDDSKEGDSNCNDSY